MYSDICVFWYLNAYMFGCFHIHRFRYHLRMKVNDMLWELYMFGFSIPIITYFWTSSWERQYVQFGFS